MNGITPQLEFTPEEAFVALAIVTVAIDGEHAEAEEMAVTQAILSADLFATYPADQLIAMINNSFQYIQDKGIEAILESAIGNLPQHLCSEALSALAKIIMADGKVSSEEKQLLNHFGQAFAIPEEKITATLDSCS
ncbi:MAG: tellurite resistance TerB family protein [Halothece sp. Uz-M2-17]|nr:tellurite resistance TerB family protein [Halothece sp. Uz-M2-17]